MFCKIEILMLFGLIRWGWKLKEKCWLGVVVKIGKFFLKILVVFVVWFFMFISMVMLRVLEKLF